MIILHPHTIKVGLHKTQSSVYLGFEIILYIIFGTGVGARHEKEHKIATY